MQRGLTKKNSSGIKAKEGAEEIKKKDGVGKAVVLVSAEKSSNRFERFERSGRGIGAASVARSAAAHRQARAATTAAATTTLGGDGDGGGDG
jgi:hypothetical protein